MLFNVQPQNALSPIDVTDEGINTLAEVPRYAISLPVESMSASSVTLNFDCEKRKILTFRQFRNGLHPMAETDEGIKIRSNDLQRQKVKSPILEIEDGISKLLSEQQPLNASFPIDNTDFGISTHFNELPLKKAR